MTLKLVHPKLTLIYGLQLFHGTPEADAGPHPHVVVRGPGGAEAGMALHVLSGTREEIRRQLLDSLDAFFELVEPEG